MARGRATPLGNSIATPLGNFLHWATPLGNALYEQLHWVISSSFLWAPNFLLGWHLMPDPHLVPTCGNLRFSSSTELLFRNDLWHVETCRLQVRRRGTSSGIQVAPPKYIYIYIYTCMCIYIYIYIHIHTYIHTYIYSNMQHGHLLSWCQHVWHL